MNRLSTARQLLVRSNKLLIDTSKVDEVTTTCLEWYPIGTSDWRFQPKNLFRESEKDRGGQRLMKGGNAVKHFFQSKSTGSMHRAIGTQCASRRR